MALSAMRIGMCGTALVLLVAGPLHADSNSVSATVECSLTSADGHIRQFAFDGKPDTYFVSEKNARKGDHFTLILDQPVQVKSVKVLSGDAKDQNQVDHGVLELSADGKSFAEKATFVHGIATLGAVEPKVRAIRVSVTDDCSHPLAIREFSLESVPPVAIFAYPFEIKVNVDDAPEMKDWALNVARTCERNFAMICTELASDGFHPRTEISMTLKNDYKGVAATSGGRIVGSVKYFKAHPDDVGAMIHETVHTVQQYRTRNNPGWLVEGVADYVRFFKYEPGKIGRINPERAKFNGSYRTTAAFLAYVTEKYDPLIVRKLNQAMRQGEYREELFKAFTKKTVQELDAEWRASLK